MRGVSQICPVFNLVDTPAFYLCSFLNHVIFSKTLKDCFVFRRVSLALHFFGCLPRDVQMQPELLHKGEGGGD